MRKVEITKTNRGIVIALYRNYDGISFQGAGKDEQEALNSMWGQYNLLTQQRP